MRYKTTLKITSVVAASLVAICSLLAQGAQSFRGSGQSVSGSVLTVSGGGETHKFQVSGSTKIVDSNGKKTDLSHALNQSVEVNYTGKKEPYHATSIQCLEQ
jgi:hypothetical protein